MTESTTRQQVLNLLGGEEGSAGKAIVDFVEETVNEKLKRNHNDIAALITEFNEVNKKALDTKADKADTDEVSRRLRAAADALSGASTAHNTAARAANADSALAEERAQQAQAATNEAGTAVSEAKLTLESLHERLENVEKWRTHHQPDLDWARRQRLTEEHEASRVPLIDHPADVHHDEHAHVEDHPPTQVQPTVEQHLATRDREREIVHTHFIDRTVDIRHWSGVQWACALLLGVVFLLWLGPVFSEWARSVMQGHAWDWVTDVMRFLGWVIAAAIGFCLGGVVGTLVDNALNRTNHADREEVHEHSAQHVAHDDHHHRVHADEVTHVR